MTRNAREKILNALKNSPSGNAPETAVPPPLRETRMDTGQLVERFRIRFEEQTGIIHVLEDPGSLGKILEDIFREHGLETAVASNDPILTSSGLLETAGAGGLDIKQQSSFESPESFRNAVFQWADAGITGADFGVAESGTLLLSFAADHARLVSLAPPVHIAVLPVGRIVPTYEAALDAFSGEGKLPSQMVLVTGPSMTADIQGIPFKGMHGPRKLVVILV